MENNSEKVIHKKPHKKFYKLKVFWFFVFVVGLFLFLIGFNFLVNQENFQRKFLEFVAHRTKSDIKFDKIHLNIFKGDFSGNEILFKEKKTNIYISLNEFYLKFDPLALLIGKLRFTELKTNELFIDTSELNKPENKKKKKKLPTFLTKIKLKNAQIDKLFWQRTTDAYLTVDKILINSKFGSIFYKSPTTMEIEKLRHISEKLDIFIENIQQEGFFVFDLTQKSIIDQSKITSKIQIDKILLAIQKRKKDWLDDRGWDKDLEPILKEYYTVKIPENKTYLYINKTVLDFEKRERDFIFHDFKIDIDNDVLIGKGNYTDSTQKLDLNIKTQSPIELSKMPLGQSKFRMAFEQFSFDAKITGNLESFEKHDLNIDLKAKLIGNLVNPPMGDIDSTLNGKIINQILTSDNVKIGLKSGTILGKAQLNLKELTTQTKIQYKDFDFQTVLRLFTGINVPAFISGNGEITGKINDPHISLNFSSPNAGYEFLQFGPISGKMDIFQKTLKLNAKTTVNQVGTSHLTLDIENLYNSKDQILDLKLKSESLEIKNLVDAQRMSGKVSGQIHLKRINTIVSGEGSYIAKHFKFLDYPMGDIKTKVTVLGKTMKLQPIFIDLYKNKTTLQSKEGIEFKFSDIGYVFAGSVFQGLKVQGEFLKSNKNNVSMQFQANKSTLKIFASMVPFDIKEPSFVTGTFDLDYNVGSPMDSFMTAQVRQFQMGVVNSTIQLIRPTRFEFKNGAFWFFNTPFKGFKGQVVLDGAVGIENNSNLKVKGLVNLSPLSDFNPIVVDSEKNIAIDLTFKENIFSPKVFGKINFNNDTIQLRNVRYDIDELYGSIVFNGNQIEAKNLRFTYDDSPIQLTGRITFGQNKLQTASLYIKGSDVPFHVSSGMNFVANVNLHLHGTSALRVDGKIDITDGEYTRNFGITNFILKPQKDDDNVSGFDTSFLPKDTRLSIEIKNSGDFMIDNNIAEMETKIDLELVGTIENPALNGQIDFSNGKINAFGINFEDAFGFAEFRQKRGLKPKVDLTGQKFIQEYEVKAKILGTTDNLRLELDSVPALDRRDILSVIVYGDTSDQLTSAERNQFSQIAALSQLASILSGPVENLSGLDVLKITTRQETATEFIQRFSIGKRLSKRFNIAFTTDLGTSDPERAIEFQYQIFDHFYIIGAKDFGSDFRLDINYRFEAD